MSELNPVDFTVGHWRQAITGFSITHPEDKQDWVGEQITAQAGSSNKASPPDDSLEVKCKPQNLKRTQLMEFPDSIVRPVAVLFQMRVIYNDEGTIGTVDAWVSTDLEQSELNNSDRVEFMQETGAFTHSFIDLNLPNLSYYANVPAKKTAVDFMIDHGLSEQESLFMTVKTAKAATFISALNTKSEIIPGLELPPIY